MINSNLVSGEIFTAIQTKLTDDSGNIYRLQINNDGYSAIYLLNSSGDVLLEEKLALKDDLRSIGMIEAMLGVIRLHSSDNVTTYKIKPSVTSDHLPLFIFGDANGSCIGFLADSDNIVNLTDNVNNQTSLSYDKSIRTFTLSIPKWSYVFVFYDKSRDFSFLKV